MSFFVVGIDHKITPVHIREKMFLAKQQALAFLQKLVASSLAEGVVVLSTCARTEIYVDGARAEDVACVVKEIDKEGASYVWIKEENEAIAHLFSLAAGVLSPVFGDRDIVHQIRCAYIASKQAGFLTGRLNRIFDRALTVSRQVRRDLRIDCRKDTNAAVLAVKKAEMLLGGFLSKRIYVLGAGVVAQAVLVELRQRGGDCVMVASRTFERARMLAQEHGCHACHLNEFYAQLSEADIVFCATASPSAVIRCKHVDASIVKRKAIFLFDLAVPRDVEQGLEKLPGVIVYTIDDLKSSGTAGVKDLLAEAAKLIDQKVSSFLEREMAYAA